MNKKSSTWYAVVNPNAGSGKTLAQWRKAEKLLFQKGISYVFETPESTSDSTEKILAACREGYRNFIAVGGDGTVHQILNTLMNYAGQQEGLSYAEALADFRLAVLPIGSGNDWIRSHNIPKDHEAIIEMICNDEFQAQDVAKASVLDPTSGEVANVAYMANVGGYNFDANVCDVVNFQKTHGVTGKLMYFKAITKIAFRQKATPTKIVCDGKEVFNELCYTISIGNGMYSGGGLCQTPEATMDDGILDLMVAPKFPILLLFFHVKKLLTKRVKEIPFIRFFKASTIEIIPEGQGQLVEIDGDIIGCAPVRIELIHRCLRVLHKDN